MCRVVDNSCFAEVDVGANRASATDACTLGTSTKLTMIRTSVPWLFALMMVLGMRDQHNFQSHAAFVLQPHTFPYRVHVPCSCMVD